VWIQWVVFAEPDDGGMSFVDHAPGPTYGHVARTASRTRNTDGGCRDPWRRGDLTGVTGKLRHATTVQPVGVCASAACRLPFGDGDDRGVDGVDAVAQRNCWSWTSFIRALAAPGK
jgi:hypothetical protein